MSMKKKNFWSAVLAMGLAATLSVGFVGCSDDDEPTPEIVTDNPLDKEVYYIAGQHVGQIGQDGCRRNLPVGDGQDRNLCCDVCKGWICDSYSRCGNPFGHAETGQHLFVADIDIFGCFGDRIG